MPGIPGEGRCVVCGREGRQAAKYRCPGCRERYCSVPCYKKHKEECASGADPATRPADSDASCSIQREKSQRAEGGPWSVDDILTEDDEDDRVPLQKLQLLKDSEELQAILSNPHLRTLLLTIDQAKDKSALMKKYMQEPVFVEFADCCLRTVEPEVKNEIPE
ncbi:zinc finger HIT domain-containing protein 3 [Pantherophis guttatus]|uniref:Zinc finger HIT domain-containing protein 3 n=1 Tax=Pantherophis guttatus TaxID=94885 RepID=A0A6P9D534_PANGU|nr:zinc finger HIT domain-containing protein 3 [Pantherophis guttatus]